jgi:hypothetical protein
VAFAKTRACSYGIEANTTIEIAVVGLDRLRGDVGPPAQESQQAEKSERTGLEIDQANSRSILANIYKPLV